VEVKAGKGAKKEAASRRSPRNNRERLNRRLREAYRRFGCSGACAKHRSASRRWHKRLYNLSFGAACHREFSKIREQVRPIWLLARASRSWSLKSQANHESAARTQRLLECGRDVPKASANNEPFLLRDCSAGQLRGASVVCAFSLPSPAIFIGRSRSTTFS